MFKSNNGPSFHFWWKENLVKHRKVSKYYETDCRWDAREEKNKEKDDGFWLLSGIFSEYIKQNIIMADLGKVNFHSVDSSKLIKYQSC